MRANWTDKVVEEKMNNGEIGWTKEKKKKKQMQMQIQENLDEIFFKKMHIRKR